VPDAGATLPAARPHHVDDGILPRWASCRDGADRDCFGLRKQGF
jgi:hypothetical protein